MENRIIYGKNRKPKTKNKKEKTVQIMYKGKNLSEKNESSKMHSVLCNNGNCIRLGR